MSVIALVRPKPASADLARLPGWVPGAFIVLAGAISALKPALDNDLGWHLRNGQAILTSHTISRVDQFSATMHGAALNNFEWLWDVSVGAIFNLAGSVGLAAINALVVAAILMCVYAVLRLRGVTSFLSALGAALAMVNLGPYLEVRPGMTGAIMAALFLFLLELHDVRRDWRLLLPLLPLEILWANCHASFILGVALCGLYALKSVLERAWKRACGLAALTLGLLAGSVANPAGPDLLRFTLGASRLAFNRSYVQEWSPPDFRDSLFAPLLLTLLLSLTLLLFARRIQLAPHRALLLLAVTASVLESAQFLPLFAVAAAPVLAEMLQQILGARADLSLRAAHGAVAATLLAVLVIGVPLRTLAPDRYRTIEATRFPVAAVAFIEGNQLQGPLWNDFGWGSYLMQAMPDMPVYVDGRAELYGQSFLSEYMDITFGRTDFAAAFDRAGIRLALIHPRSALANELRHSPGWHEANTDDIASVFVRV